MLSVILYAIVGGILFSLLGAIATYTREEQSTMKTVARDWTAGIVLTLVVYLISPSTMPPIEAVESISVHVPTLSKGSSMVDYPLQIGIQR